MQDVVSTTPPDVEAFARALAAERLRNTRVYSGFRLAGVGAFLALIVVMGSVFRVPMWQGHLHLIGPYFALALVFFAVARRSDRGAELGALAIALVDCPAIFFLVRGFLSVTPGGSPDGPATFALALYVWLTVISGFALREHYILLTAVVAGLLAGLLQQLALAPPEIIFMCVMLIALTAATTVAAVRR